MQSSKLGKADLTARLVTAKSSFSRLTTASAFALASADRGNLMGIGAVIFDFNGVLVDDEDVHFSLFREVLAREAVIITERDYHDRYLGYDDRGCLKAALTDAGQRVDDDHLNRLIQRKAELYFEVAEQGLRYFPAAAEALHSISARWPVAICSGALRTEIEYALQRLVRANQVSVIVSAEDMVKCKPDPEGYRLAELACELAVETVDFFEKQPRKSFAGIKSSRLSGDRGQPRRYPIRQGSRNAHSRCAEHIFHS